MNCALCGQDRKLVEAHVIPRSFHRIDPTDRKPTRLVTNAAGRYTRKLPKGIYDPAIVCEECERRFSPWDDYAAELFLQSWDTFQRIQRQKEDIGFSLPSYDYSRLKLFFLSVLWRAGVSGHEMFEKVTLGPHAAKLREAILTGEPGDRQYYGVVLQAFDSTNLGFLNPHPERFFGVRFYRFYLSHIIAYIKVDSLPLPEPFTALALTPHSPLVLVQKNFATSPERRIMRSLVIPDIEKSRG